MGLISTANHINPQPHLPHQSKAKSIHMTIHLLHLQLCCSSPGPTRLHCANVWISEMTKTWSEYSADRLYLGVVSKHYICHKILLRNHRQEEAPAQKIFKHKYITQPTVTPADAIIKALSNLKQWSANNKNIPARQHFTVCSKLMRHSLLLIQQRKNWPKTTNRSTLRTI